MLLGMAGGAVLQLARGQRAAPLEFAEHVVAQRRLVAHELLRPLVALERPPRPPHQRAQERQILDRIYERLPLEQLLFLPEQPVELDAVVGAEPAPEDELLRRRDRRD